MNMMFQKALNIPSLNMIEQQMNFAGRKRVCRISFLKDRTDDNREK